MDLGLERHSSDADAKKPASQGGLGPRAGQPFCCAPGNCLKGVEKPGEFCADHTLRYHGAKAVGERLAQPPPRPPAGLQAGARCPSTCRLNRRPLPFNLPRHNCHVLSPLLWKTCAGGRYEQLAGGRTVFATFSTFK